MMYLLGHFGFRTNYSVGLALAINSAQIATLIVDFGISGRILNGKAQVGLTMGDLSLRALVAMLISVGLNINNNEYFLVSLVTCPIFLITITRDYFNFNKRVHSTFYEGGFYFVLLLTYLLSPTLEIFKLATGVTAAITCALLLRLMLREHMVDLHKFRLSTSSKDDYAISVNRIIGALTSVMDLRFLAIFGVGEAQIATYLAYKLILNLFSALATYFIVLNGVIKTMSKALVTLNRACIAMFTAFAALFVAQAAFGHSFNMHIFRAMELNVVLLIGFVSAGLCIVHYSIMQPPLMTNGKNGSLLQAVVLSNTTSVFIFLLLIPKIGILGAIAGQVMQSFAFQQWTGYIVMQGMRFGWGRAQSPMRNPISSPVAAADGPIVFLTYDLELAETSVTAQAISVQTIEDEICVPLSRQIEWMAQRRVKATIFVELCQFIAMRRHFPGAWARVHAMLDHAQRAGLVRLGLHVHPNWDARNGCRVTGENVVFGAQSYAYAEGNERSIVSRWMREFDELFGGGPVAFRSGKYRPITDALRCALVNHGIRVFSSSVQAATVIADNGETFDFQNVAENVPVLRFDSGEHRIFEVPVSALNGRSLSPDYTPTAQFRDAATAMRAEGIPLCLVSHQKDLQGRFFDSHTDNVAVLATLGYRFEVLDEHIVAHCFGTYRVPDIAFNSWSLQLLRAMLGGNRVSEATITPFPEWIKLAILQWQGAHAHSRDGRIEIERIVVRRAAVRLSISVKVRGAVMYIHCPRKVKIFPVRYYLRRIYFLLPGVLRGQIRALVSSQRVVGTQFSRELDLKKFLVRGDN